MDDIGNLIYVLIFVIWFLSRLFGSGKKQVKKPLPPVDETSSAPTTQDIPRPQVTFEDILRELTGTPPQPEPVKPAQPEITYREPEPEVSYSDSEYDEVYERQTERSTPTELAPTKSVSPTDRPGSKRGYHVRTIHQMLKSKKGLRTAIIMKEILDRPYQ